MLDIKRIRKETEAVTEALLKRMDQVDFTELFQWDDRRKEIILEVEELKAKRNKVSKEIPTLARNGEDVTPLKEEMKKIGEDIKEMDGELKELQDKINYFLATLPNIPDDDVLPGGKENNQVLRVWGDMPKFEYTPKNHVDLVTDLKLIDYERGVKLGGNGFWLYKGDGALLEWALLNFFVEEHTRDGYEFILPPHILNYECGFTAGQFPKFDEDVYYLEDEEKDNKNKQFILPTSETALVNIHRDEMINEEELPKKYFAYSPCYRMEAGSHRAEERGMIRGHQFNKVEMFQFTTPEQSGEAIQELIGKAEKLVQKLGLHHRVVKLAAKDASASMAITYDIEVWIPSMNIYKEVSSASNSKDYQARRGNIRFKRKDGKQKDFVHTLNASGLATSRLIPAIVEQFQQEDGSVKVPEVLRKWINKEYLRA